MPATPHTEKRNMRRGKTRASNRYAVSFPTGLGWIVALASDRHLIALKFGYQSSDQARAALGQDAYARDGQPPWLDGLIPRLQNFARGNPEDLRDVPADLSGRTPFQRRVLRQCRQILWGHTLTYGELAARAGSHGAARAVGNIMAANSLPLVIPCHRVVGAAGTLGGFSAPGGVRVKRRLLRLEGALDARVGR